MHFNHLLRAFIICFSLLSFAMCVNANPVVDEEALISCGGSPEVVLDEMDSRNSGVNHRETVEESAQGLDCFHNFFLYCRSEYIACALAGSVIVIAAIAVMSS